MQTTTSITTTTEIVIAVREDGLSLENLDGTTGSITNNPQCQDVMSSWPADVRVGEALTHVGNGVWVRPRTILSILDGVEGRRAIETPVIADDGIARSSYVSPLLAAHATAEAVEAVAKKCVAESCPSFDGGDMNFRLQEAGLLA